MDQISVKTYKIQNKIPGKTGKTNTVEIISVIFINFVKVQMLHLHLGPN